MSDADTPDATRPSGFEKPVFPVLIAGIVTTILTLLGLFLINQATDEFNVMGWYAARILPIGAMLVGAIAASGYGLVSYYTGIKISKGLMATVLVLQLLAYGAAQYIEYKSLGLTFENGTPVSFLTYYDVATRAIAFKPRSGSSIGSPLGTWGYAFRVLEAVGFCIGGVLVPVTLSAVPFCERCQRYKKTKHLIYLPASAKGKTALLKSKEQKVTEAQDSAVVFADAQAQVAELDALAQENRADAFRDKLQAARAESKNSGSLPQRVSVELVSCPSCGEGILKWAMLSGQGREMQRTELGSRSVTADFARRVVS